MEKEPGIKVEVDLGQKVMSFDFSEGKIGGKFEIGDVACVEFGKTNGSDTMDLILRYAPKVPFKSSPRTRSIDNEKGIYLFLKEYRLTQRYVVRAIESEDGEPCLRLTGKDISLSVVSTEKPAKETPNRKCYDIIGPLESRDRRTI